MMKRIVLACMAAALAGTAGVWAESAKEVELPTRAENFTLEDYTGKPLELYSLKDAEAVVLYFHGVGCPIVRLSAPVFERLKKEYEPKNVAFLMVNSNWLDEAPEVKTDAEDFSITAPILMDQKQTVAKSLAVKRTCATFVIDPQDDWKILYRGALDDRQDYGVQRLHNIKELAKIAIDEHLAGKEVTTTSSDAKGCLINFLAADDEDEDASS